MSEKTNSPENFTNWEIIRKTQDYRRQLTNLAKVKINFELTERDPNSESGDITAKTKNIRTPEDVENFCNSFNPPIEINLKKIASELEKTYTTVNDREAYSLTEIVKKVGLKLKKKKPKIN